MFTISNDNLSSFWKRIIATTIANNAVLKCLLNGVPLTEDTIIAFVGDFFDPEDPRFDPLSEDILKAIGEIIGRQRNG